MHVVADDDRWRAGGVTVPQHFFFPIPLNLGICSIDKTTNQPYVRIEVRTRLSKSISNANIAHPQCKQAPLCSIGANAGKGKFIGWF